MSKKLKASEWADRASREAAYWEECAFSAEEADKKLAEHCKAVVKACNSLGEYAKSRGEK